MEEFQVRGADASVLEVFWMGNPYWIKKGGITVMVYGGSFD